ncbi:MAG: hypothetical protein B7Z80_05400 [Rhodospirillales bacterium 20-64-7]|nr:MAG: hypothetical protein B7Z80_05400 [Rhodospirillales bacterium 20-64-7]HQT79034.1 hypothetical protein [Rhodopila sp.]
MSGADETTGGSSLDVAANAAMTEPSRPDSEKGTHDKLLMFTVAAETGQIIKIEGIDGAGPPHELSEGERASLARESADATLETIIEQAFEAGIACVLGAAADEANAATTEQEAHLRSLLLQPLIQRSSARHLLQHDVMSRAILGTLIRQTSATHSGESGPV